MRQRYARAAAKKKYSWRRKYTRGKSGFAAKVKNVILKTAETKYISRRLQDTNMQELNTPLRNLLKHNELNYYNIFNNTSPDAVKHPLPVQGDSDGQRNGDEIYATGIRLTGTIEVFPACKQASFRLYLVEYNDQVFSAGNLGTFNEVFHNVTGSTMLDTFQHDRIRPRYLGTLRVSASDINDTQNGSINFKRWIPMKRKLTFRQDDSPALAMGIKNKVSLLILPYQTINTAQGLHIADITAHAILYYKDP